MAVEGDSGLDLNGGLATLPNAGPSVPEVSIGEYLELAVLSGVPGLRKPKSFGGEDGKVDEEEI
jgi:hypothetical protein